MGLAPMSARYVRPDWVRRVNAMGRAAGDPKRMIPIIADHLLEHAQASTGVDDAGNLGDGDWERRFRRLVDAVNASDLHVIGRLMTRQELLRCLRTRFLLAGAWRNEPSIADEEVERPLFVTGPARSGTTILFELLGLDPGVRTPIATDVIHPVVAAGVDDDERRSMTEPEQELWADIQPEFATLHELASDLPVECITICAPSFAGNHWAMVLTDQGAWTPDIRADLAFHRAVLQTVQHGRQPRQWLLKTPAYVFMLDDLVAAYPDATVIFSHRDPARTMPSTVSTTAMVQWLRTDTIDLDVLSALIGALFGDALTSIARREREGSLPGTIGHVRFADLMSEPVAAIEGVYGSIGRSFGENHGSSITSYLAAKPRGKHGTHSYTAAEWGFDADAVRTELADYLSTFEIPVEPE